MEGLTESIRENGILTPLLVRPLNNRKGEYEVISGHRRMCAAEKAGLNTVPAFVSELNRADAVIMMVDSNLHREHLLPSEKAFAYKLKLEAMKQQGKRTDLTSRQNVDKSKSADQISETDSGRQVQRYIRLTYLLPELLKLVDEGKIALTPAVYFSYLSAEQQRWVHEEMKRNDCMSRPYRSGPTMESRRSRSCQNTDQRVRQGLFCLRHSVHAAVLSDLPDSTDSVC